MSCEAERTGDALQDKKVEFGIAMMMMMMMMMMMVMMTNCYSSLSKPERLNIAKSRSYTYTYFSTNITLCQRPFYGPNGRLRPAYLVVSVRRDNPNSWEVCSTGFHSL